VSTWAHTDENPSAYLLSSNFYQDRSERICPKNEHEFQDLLNKKFEALKPLNIFMNGRSAQRIFDNYENISPGPGITIYVHRTDLIPSSEQIMRMQSLSFTIKSVNWLGDSNICEPIPLGIPPDTYKGELGKFIVSRLSENQESSSRKIQFQYYMNFDITTNIILRKRLLNLFHNRKDVYFPTSRLSISEHLQAICNSKYVLSPPGAGPDCYRTWESLYLGATPVVLKEFWPFLNDGLPVLAVDSFEDFLVNSENADLSFKYNANLEFAKELSRRYF
jgi:hypothetical protein